VPLPQLLILAGILLPGAPLAVDSTVPCDNTNKIDAFAVQLDARLKGMKVRTFAETYAQPRSIWNEVKRGEVKRGNESTGTVAAVYVADGLPVAAFFTIQTASGDWVLYADYYFRPDGSLARRHERLNTFRTNASVIRDAWFGCHGEAYGGTTQHVDLKTNKPKQPSADSIAPDFIDQLAPLYMRVQSLPFFSALKSHDEPKHSETKRYFMPRSSAQPQTEFLPDSPDE
jgi:hypothetical protein